MINNQLLDDHFYNKYHELDKESVLRMHKAYNDPRINNVVRGMHEHCYGLAVIDDIQSIQYHVYYLNGSTNLEGHLLTLDISDQHRDNLLLVFSMHIAERYSLDILETFNTFQDATRSMCEQLDYYTVRTNDLLPYKDKNPTLIAKNVKGIILVPFLYHRDLYEFLFGTIEPILPQSGDSYVYLMHNKRNNLIKIGKSVNPTHREKTLQAEEPEISMIAAWRASDRLERHLHKLYKDKRLRGEWFKLDFKDLKNVRTHVETFVRETSIT